MIILDAATMLRLEKFAVSMPFTTAELQDIAAKIVQQKRAQKLKDLKA